MTVVEVLEMLLERARSGEFSGIAVATTTPDLCTGSVWSLEEATISELLGSVAILNSRMLMQAHDGPDGKSHDVKTSLI